ncbi:MULTISPECIES: peptidylprolyl isomerase [Aeromonas]|uniref:peptidylprolyl isomerase n=2 Tax=Aeromonas TaxID=642 RepID=A0A175VL68_AEREN|nr:MULTISPECIES: peptidylprolyl isomerase [Aeromonas]KXU81506.1 peptidylprolyl isomerase [Aeromonas enteropelogenes]MBL0520078.1 peptidylprolyl isomerase [Aeromonas enteropelogenes]QXC32410.1 peptidylprolyl isomerase [Aeromonas sp. FDAARGOS 1407]RQM58549.1 peptidylprolyl isomerase [Aeromonas enteropelogenes]UBH29362.1 peptidylprolyl isomerase [Aeromonas enteropelogenes]
MKKACAQHILVKTEKQCLEIKEKIEKGADFGQMAKRFSTCPSGKRFGDLGEFSKGDMVKSFDDAVFKGELLKVLGPVRTKFGFHLIKVLYRN